MENNIFKYATKELSQDAFICWCANWFNDNSNQKLQEMSIELMKLFAGVDVIKSVSICRQFSRDVYIEAKKFSRLSAKQNVRKNINCSRIFEFFEESC